MTDKKFHDLHVGDYIADMHYGEHRLRERFDVVSHVQWDEPTRSMLEPTKHYASKPHIAGYVPHPFFDYLGQFIPSPGSYTNKSLIVIGFAEESTMRHPVIVAGYCYDGRRSGIILLKEKAA
jgi:hypothetical protein